ncbi:hypothetical protein GOBAR_AA05151 [Gossypium barbadense]|uniref:Uncharacterized protein n=1 Tax=Gossypium barbadense TaxID=3634 RepID=A0A2P5YIN5_GOSBA|nr:hypothetical protein GOBAR_AA05151 [Gossypium barbadense]
MRTRLSSRYNQYNRETAAPSSRRLVAMSGSWKQTAVPWLGPASLYRTGIQNNSRTSASVKELLKGRQALNPYRTRLIREEEPHTGVRPYENREQHIGRRSCRRPKHERNRPREAGGIKRALRNTLGLAEHDSEQPWPPLPSQRLRQQPPRLSRAAYAVPSLLGWAGELRYTNLRASADSRRTLTRKIRNEHHGCVSPRLALTHHRAQVDMVRIAQARRANHLRATQPYDRSYSVAMTPFKLKENRLGKES